MRRGRKEEGEGEEQRKKEKEGREKEEEEEGGEREEKRREAGEGVVIMIKHAGSGVKLTIS